MTMDPRLVRVNGVEIAYTTEGDSAAPAVLLVSGLGNQLTMWDDRFCALFIDRGFSVIRFDNRDSGLSTHLADPPPGPAGSGERPPAYALSDLAADAAGLLAALGVDSAHVVGVSMGGMIAQLLAIEHPARVASLTSIMSTTGDPGVGHATAAAVAVLTAPPARSREAAQDQSVSTAGVIGSPRYPATEDVIRAKSGAAFDRAHHPSGVARQLQACVTAPDRTEALRRLTVLTLVIHGADDPLIGVSGGRATAAAVPGAELLVIDGMGHDLPEPLWSVLVDAIVELAESVEQGSRSIRRQSST